MTLKFAKMSDAAFNRISILIHGEPGRGKTSLLRTLCYDDDTVFGSEAAQRLEAGAKGWDWSKVLYVAADPGQLALRGLNDLNVVSPCVPGGMSALEKHLRESGTRYSWVMIDGLDNLGEYCLRAFLERDAARPSPNSLKAYGEFASFVRPWIESVRDCGTSVIFVTHTERIDGADVKYTPMFPGNKVSQQLDAMFDEVLCLRMVSTREGAKPERMLQCKPDPDPLYQVKDRSGKLLAFEKPNLGALMRKILG